MTDKLPDQPPSGDKTRLPSAVVAARAGIGERLKAFQAREVERILSTCTRCGKCFSACPMTGYATSFKGTTPDLLTGESVVNDVLAVLRGEKGSPQALGWIAVCCRSGECVPACPEKVDPLMMMRLARMTALGGRGVQKQIAMREDPDYFNRARAFAKLQLSDEELRQWT